MASYYKAAQKFYSEVYSLCKPDCYNIFLHKHLGDVFYAIGSKEKFENTYNTRLYFIVRPDQEFLMQMYDITGYSVYDFSWFERECIEIKFPFMLEASHKSHHFDMICKALFSGLPVKGLPFILDSEINNFFLFNRFWARLWPTNMGLEEEFQFTIPKCTPILSDAAKKALEKAGDISRMVLFAPEASTALEFPGDFWDIIAERVHAHGYKIIVNSRKYKIKHGICVFDLDLSLSDIVALGLSCAYVFSVRSGLCDVLVGARNRMYVFYPANIRREFGGLNKCFEPAPNVNEIALWRWKIDTVEWEGENLTRSLQKNINLLHRACGIEFAQIVLTLINQKKRQGHFFWHRLFRDLADKSTQFANNNRENGLSI
ncbi:hypothetical protein FACS1894163_06970 [Spirochaetia bacterium]|nr:hypothetical protein FACS1894163_06970 [Spirochaetia bacterium]